MKNTTILVTGANGQLGNSLRKIAGNYPGFEFVFTDVEQLDITDPEQIERFFSGAKPTYCINAAAYTNVDKAETDTVLNNRINAQAPGYLAKACKRHGAVLIHISSDYVYGDDGNTILDENSPVNPKGQYAIAKLEGEYEVSKHTERHYIIRTSWLYSEYGKNFVKTIIRLSREKDELNVVDDQIGSPTYARDLAVALMHIVSNDNARYGIYNFSNCGFTSWYDFAKEILKYHDHSCKINPIPSSQYPTPAPRPLNSRMSKRKIIDTFGMEIPQWQESLKSCINRLKTGGHP